MALNFPLAPVNGDLHTFINTTYKYNATNDSWESVNFTGNSLVAAATTDPTARSTGAPLQEGDIYYNTADDTLKVYDGTAWVSPIGPSADLTYSLGTTTLRWANVYGQDFGLDENDKMRVETSQIDFYIDGSNEFRMQANGDFHADGNITAYSTTTASDRNLKENIVTIQNPFDILNAINGVTFDWKKDGSASAGVIAQEVEAVMPSAVKEAGIEEKHKVVDYNQLIGVLVEAIKELKEEVETLKGK